MVQQSLNPWLADFLWSDIEAVITWRRAIDSKIKPDPDSRFSDDGSNFRGITIAPPPGEKLVVQLTKVLSVEEDVAVVLSDSKTRVRARLSEAAVAALEAEAGKDFGFEVTGDVFQLIRFTVITTHFGPADEFVQILVDDIEYEHHRRQIIGHPTAIEEDDNIRDLLDDIVQLRCPQDISANVSETGGDRQISITPENAGLPGRQSGQANGHAPTTSVPQSSPPVSSLESQPVHTQYVLKGRQSKATLAKDGFELQTGLNLDRPLQPGGWNELRYNNVSDSRAQPAFGDDTGKKLLGLLNRNDHDKADVIAETPARPQNKPISSGPEASLNRLSSLKSQAIQSQSMLSSRAAPALPNRSPTSAQPPPESLKGSMSSTGGLIIPYERKKIPNDQKKLLDQPESWIPSLPGKRFPTPNVPIRLLDLWSKAAVVAPASQDLESAQLEPSNINSRELEEESVSGSDPEHQMSDEDGSEHEFTTSQWPPTPAQKQDLPPDSSFEGVVRGTLQDDLEIIAPRALPTEEIVARPAVTEKESLRTTASQTTMRHPLPSRPAVTMPPHSPLPVVIRTQSLPSTGETDQSERSPQMAVAKSTKTMREKVRTRTGEVAPDEKCAKELRMDEKSHETMVRSPQKTDLMPTLAGSPNDSQSRMLKSSPEVSPSLTRPRPLHSSPFRNPSMVGRSRLSQRGPDPSVRPPTRDRSSVSSSMQPFTDRNFGATKAYQVSQPQRSPPVHLEPQSSPISDAQVPVTSPADNATHRSSQPGEHPDDRHRRIRREHLAALSQRQDWIYAHYIPHRNGKLKFQSVLISYRASHREDRDVTARDFSDAVRQAYGRINIAPLRMTFNRRPRPNQTQSSDTQRQRAAAVHPNGKQGIHGESRTPPEAAQKSAANDAAEEDVLTEFCRNWLNIQPGGHFAHRTAAKPVRRRVDVLKWDL